MKKFEIRNSKFELEQFAPNESIIRHAVSILLAIKNYLPLANRQRVIRRFLRNDLKLNLLLIISLISFFIFFTPCKSQTLLDSTKLVSSFTVNAKFVQADNLGNLYIVSPTNQLNKYNYKGKILATLNYNYNGNISSIDASNPMEIYVFYKELNRVLLLDNNLAYRGELDLTKLNITQAAGIARSFDNGIWVFDVGDLQLKKITKEGIMNQSSGNIKQFTKTDFIPNSITDNTNQIMLCNDSICLIFDVFAAYVKTFKFSNSTSFQLGNNYLFETNKNQITSIDLKMGIRQPIYSFNSSIFPKWTYVSKENIIIFQNNQVLIFK